MELDTANVVVDGASIIHYKGCVMLTFVEECDKKSKDNHKLWVCRCECGVLSTFMATRVRHKRVSWCRSCAAKISAVKTHGMRNLPEYTSWVGAKMRCSNPRNKDYYRYGGKGVTMCQEWMESFEAFFLHVGHRPAANYSIDRIDNNKGYEPGNVRWATKSEQSRNQSRSVYVTDGNRRLHIVDLAKELGISKAAAHLRLKRGKLDGFTKD